MKFTIPPLTSLLILLLCSLHTFSQDSAILTKPASSQSILQEGEPYWQNLLKKNVDTTVPFQNKAKKGTYTVVVVFVLANDGNLSDILAKTNYGYGMEQEVIRVLKKGTTWVPAPQNVKPTYTYHKTSFTFVVSKRKLFGKRRP